MAKEGQATQPDFSVKKPYFLQDEESRGIGRASHYPTDFNEASNFRTPAKEDIKEGYVTSLYSSPLTTKGDIAGFSNTDTRIPVGSNDFPLIADSTEALGVRWADRFWVRSPFRKRLLLYPARTSGTSALVTSGHTGTASASSTTAVYTDSSGLYLQQTTATTVDTNTAIYWGNEDATQLQLSPMIYIKIKTGSNSTDLESVRSLFGLVNNSNSNVILGSDTPAISFACFRYSTSADGTAFWRCVTDNASGTPQATTTTVAVTTNTAYEFLIDATTASTVRFWINGAVVATHTSVLPASTTEFSFFCGCRNLSAGTARSFKFASLHCEMD